MAKTIKITLDNNANAEDVLNLIKYLRDCPCITFTIGDFK